MWRRGNVQENGCAGDNNARVCEEVALLGRVLQPSGVCGMWWAFGGLADAGKAFFGVVFWYLVVFGGVFGPVRHFWVLNKSHIRSGLKRGYDLEGVRFRFGRKEPSRPGCVSRLMSVLLVQDRSFWGVTCGSQERLLGESSLAPTATEKMIENTKLKGSGALRDSEELKAGFGGKAFSE